MRSYGQLLKSKKYKVGIWGTGYIGFSTMAFFAKNVVQAIGYDISKEKVNIINRGGYILQELKTWLDFSVKPLVMKGLLKATTDYRDFIKENVIVHFVAIPTEKDGLPYFVILKDVIKKICEIVKKGNSKIRSNTLQTGWDLPGGSKMSRLLV